MPRQLQHTALRSNYCAHICSTTNSLNDDTSVFCSPIQSTLTGLPSCETTRSPQSISLDLNSSGKVFQLLSDIGLSHFERKSSRRNITTSHSYGSASSGDLIYLAFGPTTPSLALASYIHLSCCDLNDIVSLKPFIRSCKLYGSSANIQHVGHKFT